MNETEFFEYVQHDLKGIKGDLKGFLEVYYPMLRSSWNPKHELEFILGWFLGNKEQEYSAVYYTNNNKKMGMEILYRIHREITKYKQFLHDEVVTYLEEKSSD